MTLISKITAGVAVAGALTLGLYYFWPQSGRAVQSSQPIPASFSINPTGALNWSMEIAVPPGIQNVEPQLSISYSSQNASGLLGVGFNLNGLSQITRTAATLAQDGFNGGVGYNAADRFQIDGNRLMLMDGSAYGAANSVYHTQNESWTKVVAVGQSGSGPQSFQVWTKKGIYFEYGNTDDARVTALSASATAPFPAGSVRQWLVNKCRDLHGNTLTLEYTQTPPDSTGKAISACTGQGQVYPLRIDYTANDSTPALRSVQFVYEQRPDSSTCFIGGSRFSTRARMSAIRTFVKGEKGDSVLVREVRILYEKDSPLNASRIASITVRGGDDAYAPTSFDWSEGQDTLLPKSISWTGNGTNVGFVGDFNGDGRNDILQSNAHVYLGTASGFEDAGNSGIFYNSSMNNFVGDFNGDGISDFLEASSGSGTIYYFNPQTNTFSSSKSVSGMNISTGCYPSKCVWQGDFNGDGMSDICSAIEETVYVNFGNAANGLNPYKSQSGLQVYAGNTYAADFNGDGLADIFSCNQNTGYLTLSNWSLATSDGFLPTVSIPGMNFTISSTEAYTWVGDYNGDGLADILAKGNDQNYRLYYATGTGFQSGKIVDINLSTTAVWPADFNHDGEMDFYAASSNSGIIYWSDGMDFSAQQPVNYLFEPQYTWLGDFNGDGLTDLFNAYSKQVYYGGNAAAGNQSVNQQGNLVTGIRNGTGSVASLTYKPITDTTVYKAGASTASVALEGQRAINRFNTFPLSPVQNQLNGTISIQTAMFVVSNYSISDGRGASYAYQQQYAGAKYDMTGYGFLGYQQVSATDLNRAAVQKTFYLQDYPFTGITDSTVTLDMAGNLYSATAYVWDSTAIPSATQVPCCQVLQRVKNSYQFYQQKISCQGQQLNWYDAYGNLQKSSNTGNLASPATLWTFSTYANDTSSWQLGYVTSAKQCSDSGGNQWLSAVRVAYNSQRSVDSVYTWFSSSNSWLSKSFGYDLYGNQVVQTSYAGDTTRIEYDPVYHSFAVRDYSPRNAQGQTLLAQAAYEPFYGNAVTATDPNGNVFSYVYDGLGRFRQAWIPDSTGKQVLGMAQNYVQADTGYVLQQISRHDWAGTLIDTSFLSYDGMNRVYQSQYTGWGNKTVVWQQTSNAAGQVVAATSPYFVGGKAVWSYASFDPIGRLLRSVTPYENTDSVVTRFIYQGLTTQIIRAAGTPDSTVSAYTYNYVNNKRRVVKFVNAAGMATTYAWDLLGRLNKATDPGGNQTASAWNSLNLNDWAYTASTDTTFYFYQPLQQSEFSVNALHDTIYSHYDNLGRIILSKAQRSQPIAFQYDVPTVKNGLGNLCLVTQDNGATSYSFAYDAMGNATSEQAQLDGRAWQQYTSYNPDLSRASLRFPNGMQAVWAYDRAGQAVSVSQIAPGGATKPVTTVNDADATGSWLAYTYGNGVQTQKGYYADESLQSMVVSGSGNLWSKTYDWTRHGLIEAINDAIDPSDSETYSYSPTGRLLKLQASWGRDSFAYSNVGNLTWNDSIAFAYTGYQVKTGTRGGKTVYSALYNAAGQQSSRNLYENEKNLAYTYKYNGYGQMDSVYRNDTLVQVYTYDFSGTRNRVINLLRSSTSYQVFDNYSEYVGNGRQGSYCSFDMGGTTLASFSDTDSVEYYTCNQNSSTVLVTGSQGQVLKRFSYSPYGKFRAQGIDSTYAQHKFNGKEFDEESGLYYFNFRYYDPFSCRFNSPDDQLGGSLTTPDALNNYAFVNNSPITLSDPSGHQPLGAKAAETALELLALAGVDVLAEGLTDGAATPFVAALDETVIVDVAKKGVIDLTTDIIDDTVSDAVEEQAVGASNPKKRKLDDAFDSDSGGDDSEEETHQKKVKYWDSDDSDSEDMDDPDDLDFKMKESRPSMSADNERIVFKSGMGSDGKVHCARCDKVLTGKKTYQRGSKLVRDWQKGHLTGYEYFHLKGLRDKGKIPETVFIRAVKDPMYYRPECPPCNLSHFYESHTKSNYNPLVLKALYQQK